MDTDKLIYGTVIVLALVCIVLVILLSIGKMDANSGNIIITVSVGGLAAVLYIVGRWAPLGTTQTSI
jgi:hypothetical protein